MTYLDHHCVFDILKQFLKMLKFGSVCLYIKYSLYIKDVEVLSIAKKLVMCYLQDFLY